MKTVILCRHAKSSWDDPNLSDIDRPLNDRGLRDSTFMGNILKEKEIMPDLIISSPAVRAFSTAKFYAKALGYLLDNILIENSVYEGGAKGIIELLEKIDENSNTVLVFGHNPDMTHLAALFSGIRIDNIPTSGIVCIDFDCKNWAKITNKKGKIRFLEYPKKYLK